MIIQKELEIKEEEQTFTYKPKINTNNRNYRNSVPNQNEKGKEIRKIETNFLNRMQVFDLIKNKKLDLILLIVINFRIEQKLKKKEKDELTNCSFKPVTNTNIKKINTDIKQNRCITSRSNNDRNDLYSINNFTDQKLIKKEKANYHINDDIKIINNYVNNNYNINISNEISDFIRENQKIDKNHFPNKIKKTYEKSTYSNLFLIMINILDQDYAERFKKKLNSYANNHNEELNTLYVILFLIYINKL